VRGAGETETPPTKVGLSYRTTRIGKAWAEAMTEARVASEPEPRGRNARFKIVEIVRESWASARGARVEGEDGLSDIRPPVSRHVGR
jgi:hypothetical protein